MKPIRRGAVVAIALLGAMPVVLLCVTPSEAVSQSYMKAHGSMPRQVSSAAEFPAGMQHSLAPPRPVPPFAGAGTTTLPNLSDESGWPEPVASDMRFGSLLFDLFEFQSGDGPDLARWDVVGWYGGDWQRVWFKSEGQQNATRDRSTGESDFQVLYGWLIAPFFDFQAGLRYERQWQGREGWGRTSVAVGLQGVIPYGLEIESTLFVSEEGDISARITASQDVFFTQRLIMQPRIEINAAAQEVERFGVGEGLNSIEMGLRLRYEIIREVAPYVGVNWTRKLGSTADFLGEDENPGIIHMTVGIRMWF